MVARQKTLTPVSLDAKATTYRTLPHNIEAEQALLGAILTNNEAINQVGDFLRSEHFYEPVHQRIFDSINQYMERGLIATPVTLKPHFDRDEMLKEAGGAAYLAKIAGLASHIINVKDHARIIFNLFTSRSLINIGEEMVNHAYESRSEESASEQIEKAEQKLFNLASDGSSDRYFVPIKNLLVDAIALADNARNADAGITTGFMDIDQLLGGFQNSDLVILAARPSMGKTALALNMAYHAAEALKKKHDAAEVDPATGKKPPLGSVGFFSLEMSGEQLALRLLSLQTKIPSHRIRRGMLNKTGDNNEHDQLIRAGHQLHPMPIYIDDTPAQTISAVRTRARRLKRKHNLSLLVIDYLQLIRAVTSTSMNNRVQEVSEITQGLKAIAKELNIPVVALSQLSRAVEQRENKRPQLADLRESGTIEQDSDVVMFLYRESYYTERDKPPEEDAEKFSKWQEKMERISHIAEVQIGKHRNGPIGTVELYFDKMTTSFRNLLPEEREPSNRYSPQ